MSKPQHQRQSQVKEARLEIVSKLYKRGYSIRKIRAEVMTRLDLRTYAVSTVHDDIQTLLREWRDSRLVDTDQALQLELTRIDDTVRELWEQWEKSKEDYTKTKLKRKGTPTVNAETGRREMRTDSSEETSESVVGLGNPQYIAEIRQQLAERRKLLGLYAPEKRELSGGLSFAEFLMESGQIEDAENSIQEMDTGSF